MANRAKNVEKVVGALKDGKNSVAQIASSADLAPGTVRQVLKGLVDEGRVKVSGATDTGKPGRPSFTYTLVENEQQAA